MSWMEFVSAMTGHIAWPAAVVALALIFRRQLAGLVGALDSWEGFGQKFTFSRRLARMEKKVGLVTGSVYASSSSTHERPAHPSREQPAQPPREQPSRPSREQPVGRPGHNGSRGRPKSPADAYNPADAHEPPAHDPADAREPAPAHDPADAHEPAPAQDPADAHEPQPDPYQPDPYQPYPQQSYPPQANQSQPYPSQTGQQQPPYRPPTYEPWPSAWRPSPYDQQSPPYGQQSSPYGQPSWPYGHRPWMPGEPPLLPYPPPSADGSRSSSPAADIMASWELVLLSLRYLRQEAIGDGAKMSTDPQRILEDLRTAGVVDDDLVTVVEELKDLRDQVAHGYHKPTAGEALTYATSATSLRQSIDFLAYSLRNPSGLAPKATARP
ncbi:hypothetical protein EV652_103126 [Kribbella steppae]|uniref:DUF4145 domain-containing protein n=1 Tax=Kribbella steppae TaxID=2512223 RepID=A0A4R2HPZ6_9ACTN|nr:hypothetical protein [Kribbella steppae]TCO33127.1 hypothetical protein EV652_103126 [Kribbella steppae]